MLLEDDFSFEREGARRVRLRIDSPEDREAFYDYASSLPSAQLSDGEEYLLDLTNSILIHSYDVQEAWRFETPQAMQAFLEKHEETGLAAQHVFTPRAAEPAPEPISLERKLEHKVFQEGHWLVLKLPADVDFVYGDGVRMQHCLGSRYVAKDYCTRMAHGEIDVYSLVDTRDNEPRVNIEVSHTKSSYGGPVDRATVTQVRGRRNQIPPSDEFISPLMAFFAQHPEWDLSGHGIRSFDGKVDGDVLVRRWHELQSESANPS